MGFGLNRQLGCTGLAQAAWLRPGADGTNQRVSGSANGSTNLFLFSLSFHFDLRFVLPPSFPSSYLVLTITPPTYLIIGFVSALLLLLLPLLL